MLFSVARMSFAGLRLRSQLRLGLRVYAGSWVRLDRETLGAAARLARPAGCTHRRGSMSTGRLGRLHDAMNMRLPNMNRGVTRCLNRATGTAGLSIRWIRALWAATVSPELLPRTAHRRNLDRHRNSANQLERRADFCVRIGMDEQGVLVMRTLARIAREDWSFSCQFHCVGHGHRHRSASFPRSLFRRQCPQ